MSERNVAVCVILSLVTCGLYGIYWFIVMTNEVGTLSGDDSFTGVKYFLLGIITCGIWFIVWHYQIGKKVTEAQAIRGMRESDNAVLYVVLGLFGFSIVTYALVQSDLNQFM